MRVATEHFWMLSPDVLITFDAAGTLHSMSPGVTAVLGWRQQDMIGRNLQEFLHPDDAFPGVAEALPLQFENRYRHQDGSFRTLSWRAALMNGLVYACGKDVTLEKDQARALVVAEENLRQAQKMEAVGQLTGGIAHDFNNLLTIIRTSIDLMRRPSLTEDRRARFMEAVLDAVTRASKLTGQLLTFARRQAHQAVVFDAAKNVFAIGDMLRTLVGSRITIDVLDDGVECLVDADPGQFDTAIVNLAINARDAMAGAGTLSISTRRVAWIPQIRDRPALVGDFVAVSLSDSGTGIEPARLAQIFEPFFTTKAVGQGTGLGLSQVSGFAKRSGGDIDVTSTVAVGSTFTLYLPLARRSGSEPVASDASDPVRSINGGRILLVEDNRPVAASIEQTLLELGYAVETVHNASEALAALADNPLRFAVVFSDVVMDGMDGIHLAREIRRRHPDMPVLLSSGYGHILSNQSESGFPLLAKPYSLASLAEKLERCITNRDDGSPAALT